MDPLVSKYDDPCGSSWNPRKGSRKGFFVRIQARSRGGPRHQLLKIGFLRPQEIALLIGTWWLSWVITLFRGLINQLEGVDYTYNPTYN